MDRLNAFQRDLEQYTVGPFEPQCLRKGIRNEHAFGLLDAAVTFRSDVSNIRDPQRRAGDSLSVKGLGIRRIGHPQHTHHDHQCSD
jgi:hypothetical protein